MASANKVLSIAAGEVGYSRWDDPQAGTKYGRAFAEKVGNPYYGNSGVPYCCMFVWWVLDRAGMAVPGMPTASCTALRNACANAGMIVPKMSAQPGDIVIFDWPGSRDGANDHVGFVELNRSTYIQTIEGNTSSGASGSQGNGGVVARRTRDWSVVQDVIRPAYGSDKPLPDALKKYTDLDAEAWYIDPLDKAVRAGIVHGNGDKLRPNDTATRAEVAAMLANALKL